MYLFFYFKHIIIISDELIIHYIVTTALDT